MRLEDLEHKRDWYETRITQLLEFLDYFKRNCDFYHFHQGKMITKRDYDRLKNYNDKIEKVVRKKVALFEERIEDLDERIEYLK